MRRLLAFLAAGVPLAAALCLPADASAESRGSGSAPLDGSTVSVRAPAGTEAE